jgi:hypothetical protein
MKDKYNKVLDNLKRLYEDLLDKRCKYLQEERNDYKHKVIKIERSLKDKEEAVEFLSNELRILRSKTEEEISYRKIQLKIKSEELDRIQTLHEENINIIKIFKNENDGFRDKTDLLKTELISKEAEHKEKLSEYKAELNIFRKRIANYDISKMDLIR